MSNLSPAAQAVLDAFRAVPDLRDCPSIAAALRAAAYQVVPTQENYQEASNEFAAAFFNGMAYAANELRCIADKLEDAK
jgi:hypothetical protein